jgi:hypothetical protein
MKAHHKIISSTIWITHFKTKCCHIQCSNQESAWKSWTEIIQSLHKFYTNLCISSFSTKVTQICISDFSTNLYTNLRGSNNPLKVAVQEAQDKDCLKNQILTTSWANSAQQSLISKWCTKFHFTQILSAIHWNSPTSCSQWVNLQTIVLEKFFYQRRFIIDFISGYSLRMARD